ncbi:MAG: type IV pili twitching motility protein PilT [Elusimicrobia bacterium CG1_02_37_114]|nr:MAG: type IV pili twitching motility protein PilT [Elusimicrobia bacterium CG1_02_37_114]PIV54023.1 MAG: type IV pili twitching motility protein PilT [Elusimicrobia bacterium CG02_land_8_20_14_3_00_37_13]PIZ13185.1 MAG: type IV pili twitching motility protein PilT [Elusimicrobia bacterium CG_4_10_14_0_8_um_filter_37_32]
MNITEILQTMIKSGISDIHFKADSSPLIRLHGKLMPTKTQSLSPKNIEELAYSLMSKEQQTKFEQENELDMSYSIEGLSRFRINIYRQRGTPALTLRVVPTKIKTFEELNLPATVLKKLSSEPRGLILITGVTGAGKTTTLNSMLDSINTNFNYNIVTVEDPIEFCHKDKKSSISQREVGTDTKSFKNALKYVLRQDPDVVVMGEMREFDAMSAGITAAETGHLVISTIHTIDSVQTIDRIIDSYPEHQQKQVRSQLSNVLKGVIGQRLCHTVDGEGRIPAIEILVGNSTIRKLIIENKTQDIYKAMELGGYYSMQTFDQSLQKLCQENKITLEEALDKSTNPEDLKLKLKGITGGE